MSTQTDRLAGISDGLGRKAPVRFATTGQITLAGLKPVDGSVETLEGDAVLVWQQPNAAEHGIWLASSGPWTRRADFDGPRDAVTGTAVLVAEGAKHGGIEFALQTPSPIVIGETPLTFRRQDVKASQVRPLFLGGAANQNLLIGPAVTSPNGMAIQSVIDGAAASAPLDILGSTVNVLADALNLRGIAPNRNLLIGPAALTQTGMVLHSVLDGAGADAPLEFQASAYTFTGGTATFVDPVVAEAFAIDVNFYVQLIGNNPAISWNPFCLSYFDRAAGVFFWTLGGTQRFGIASNALSPVQDNVSSLGRPAERLTTVYAATGTINTSDANEKTGRGGDADPLSDEKVSGLTAQEIGWAQDLAAELGVFKFKTAVAEKGDAARLHVGMTVQKAIALGQARGLDPFDYAFICFDRWDASPEQPAIYSETERDPQGDPLMLQAAQPGRPAGERYAFRSDQLALFIAAGACARA